MERVRDLGLFATRLQEATDFIDVGRIVCELAESVFDIHQVVTALIAPDGRPVISIDNLQGEFDEMRVAYFDQIWRVDPFLAALRIRHVPLGADFVTDEDWMRFSRDTGRYEGDNVYTITLPILAVSRLIGMIRCGALAAYSIEHQRDLAAMSSHVAVRLAQLGITPSDNTDDLGQLTARQLEVAHLAAEGSSNPEIAERLGLSASTAKKHLHSVFERLGLSNRAELVLRFARVGRQDTAPVGITHRAGYTITKLPAT